MQLPANALGQVNSLATRQKMAWLKRSFQVLPTTLVTLEIFKANSEIKFKELLIALKIFQSWLSHLQEDSGSTIS